MSLLMDALKRAEEAKRQQQGVQTPPAGDASAPASDLALEPVDSGPSSVLPDLQSHIESVEADLKATAAESGARDAGRTGGAAEAAQRQTAQTVFAAKQETPPAGTSVKRLLAIGTVGLLAAAGVGGYFYWQLQLISGTGNRLAARPGSVTPTRPVSPPALPQIPAAAPATPVLAPTQAATPAPGIAKLEPGRPLAETAPPTRPAVKPVARPTPRPDKPVAVAAAETPTRQRAAPAAETGPAVRVSAQAQEPQTLRAYDDLQAGRLDAARNGYQQALKADRRNVDALLGLAAIAQREGQPDVADRYYQAAIEADPRNAAAHAGLIALRGDGDAIASESRLKNLLAQPGNDPAATGALQFALGNLYAGQRRWSEAQQAYFKAHAADAEQPDYLYNLAVSLDHLGQAALARQFYDKALQAAKSRPAAFDKAQGERRLAELQR